MSPVVDHHRLALVPCTLSRAFDYVRDYHRDLDAPPGGLFAVGVARGPWLADVAIAGRPISRMLDDGFTIEVTRVATDTSPNTCSMLYGATWRAARALGHRRGVTYTLANEPGTSLRAAGWRCVGVTAGGTWSRASRARDDRHPTCPKLRWQIETADYRAIAAVNDQHAPAA